MSTRAYGWKVSQVHQDFMSESDKQVASRNPPERNGSVHWSMYDDDGECYASGIIWGDYTGFEPLEDWGYGALGCTRIKVDGEWL